MFFTKGEFIQALKDYPFLKSELADLKSEYEKLQYLRFNKVSSSLDYDIIGYEGEEPIRELKGHGYVNKDTLSDYQKKLEEQIENASNKVEKVSKKIEETEKMLISIEMPLRNILIDKYINKLTYIQLSKKYQKELVVSYPMAIKRYVDSELDKYIKRG